MGIKGCGEAGTVGAVSATANAVTDALWESGAKIFDIPFSSFNVWELLHERRSNQ
jgi:carbon-monoxide dehydrogenase large subunit